MRPRLATVLLPALVYLTSAWAHQQHEAITRVLFNPRTGNIEVMHRFLLHDVEHAVKEMRGNAADILVSEKDREFFAAYVNQRFDIADQAGQRLVLKPVGHEIEGRFLWVYSETPITANIRSLGIRHDALRDIWPTQVNLVNVERNGEVSSAALTDGDRQITIHLHD